MHKMDKQEWPGKIKELQKERKAVILAHLYQPDEIQEIADFTGDSLELSRYAAKTEAEVIVCCGVRFMAETAKILSPEKVVLLPVLNAGCYLADRIKPEDVERLKKAHPQAAVVSYVNTTAAVKAVSDYCCTSTNAIKVVRGIPADEIIFIPDKNLGRYVAEHVPEKKIIIWDGHCPVHDRITEQEITKVRLENPQAEILVHPECKPEVAEKADFVGSTAQIIRKAGESRAPVIVIGTERGVLYQLRQKNPDKAFRLLAPDKLLCGDMKKIRLEDVYLALKEMKNQIQIEEEVASKAVHALERMLEVG